MLKELLCSARIENESERKALMAWVRQVANAGYSEKDNVVAMAYSSEYPDVENTNRWQAIIHVFEQYPEHSIKRISI